MKRFVPLLIFFILLVIPVCALAKRVLSLKDAVSIAIKQNPEISASLKEKETFFYQKNVVRAEFFPKVYLNYEYRRTDPGKDLPTTDLHEFGPTINWNIFSGFSTWYAYQEALKLVDASDAQVRAKIQDVALRVVFSYLDYLRMKALWEASLTDIEDAQVALRLAQRRYEVGLSPLADVLDAEARLKEATANSINYKYASEIAKARLLTLLNLSVLEGKDTELMDFSEELSEPALEVLIASAKKRRPELLAKERELLAQEDRIKSIRGEYFPSVDLFSSYYRVDNSFFPDKDHQFIFGLRINLPLFTGFSTPSKLSAERAKLEKKRFEKRTLELDIEQAVYSAYQNYLTKKEYYEASVALLKKMEEDYRIAKKRYENGLSSIVELTTVMARLSEARSQVARSRYDWYQSYFQLKREAGFVPGLE